MPISALVRPSAPPTTPLRVRVVPVSVPYGGVRRSRLTVPAQLDPVAVPDSSAPVVPAGAVAVEGQRFSADRGPQGDGLVVRHRDAARDGAERRRARRVHDAGVDRNCAGVGVGRVRRVPRAGARLGDAACVADDTRGDQRGGPVDLDGAAGGADVDRARQGVVVGDVLDDSSRVTEHERFCRCRVDLKGGGVDGRAAGCRAERCGCSRC